MKYIIDVPDRDYSYNEKLHMLKLKFYDDNLSCEVILDAEQYTEPDRKDIEDEVWELANKLIWTFPERECRQIFGMEAVYVPRDMTYQEAKSKYEAWLKQKDQIRVGDELKDDGNIKAVVLDIMNEDYVSYEVFTENGIVDEWQKGIVVKTGRHFPEVAELLEKMRGDSDEQKAT